MHRHLTCLLAFMSSFLPCIINSKLVMWLTKKHLDIQSALANSADVQYIIIQHDRTPMWRKLCDRNLDLSLGWDWLVRTQIFCCAFSVTNSGACHWQVSVSKRNGGAACINKLTYGRFAWEKDWTGDLNSIGGASNIYPDSMIFFYIKIPVLFSDWYFLFWQTTCAPFWETGTKSQISEWLFTC